MAAPISSPSTSALKIISGKRRTHAVPIEQGSKYTKVMERVAEVVNTRLDLLKIINTKTYDKDFPSVIFRKDRVTLEVKDPANTKAIEALVKKTAKDGSVDFFPNMHTLTFKPDTLGKRFLELLKTMESNGALCCISRR